MIYLDLGGTATQFTQETGFQVKPHSPEQAVQNIVQAMTYLAINPELRLCMGKAFNKRAKEALPWQNRGQELAPIYKKIAAQNQSCWK